MQHIITLFTRQDFYTFVVGLILCSLKLYFATFLFCKKVSSPGAHKAWRLLFGLLISSLFIDCVSLLSATSYLFFPAYVNPPGSNMVLKKMWRFAWGAYAFQYLFLIFFLESLIDRKYFSRWYHYFYCIVGSTLALYCISETFISSGLGDPRPIISYAGNIGLFVTIIILYQKLKAPALPRILKKQIKFLQCVVGIFAAVDISPFLNSYIYTFAFQKVSIFTYISASLLTASIFFSYRRIIGIRFLNYEDHVKADKKYHFIDIFKNALASLGNAFKPEELNDIVRTFFHEIVHVQKDGVHLFIRKANNDKQAYVPSPIEADVERLLASDDEHEQLLAMLHDKKILIRDELEFSDFYEDTQLLKEAINFLKTINADVFVPVFDQNQEIIAYIIVDFPSRQDQLYTDVERDEMMIFASYLSNVIYLFQHKNLDALIQKEKELNEELYLKHQEIAQYQESIRSFARSQEQRKIGLVFYKNRKFIFGNQAAQELITININTQQGHPLTKALKDIAQRVEEYKTSQHSFSHDAQGNKLVITGLPNLEHNNVILMVYYPEISDILNQANNLKDPSEWDYLLYLETTKSGQLINKLIPGNGQTLLTFKIELLKTALSKKATLLELPDADALAVAECLHLVSLREQMHVLKLQAPCKNTDVLIKLFGMNPIFGMNTGKALLEILDQIGTLYIENIHFLDLETQKYLADFIKYGFYKVYKSEQRVVSSVRIIGSTTQNLALLAQEGRFLPDLIDELKKTSLTMPSLLTLSEFEFAELADGFVDQVVRTETYKNLLELTDTDKNKLTVRRPATLQEFKTRIQNLLVNKSKKSQIYDEVHFDPAYNINDPDLAQAARLGKHALRDPRIMTMLWNKFRNQSKIATFLGVNRSSVNRKIKDFNII